MSSNSLWLRVALSLLGALFWVRANAAEPAVVLPPPKDDVPLSTASGSETAVLAGGCFWGVQGVFQHTRGVTQVVSGYSGGSRETAHYHRVGAGDTGHAESVEITYDPHAISYGTLLQIFFSVAHNPTELDRQGPDTGTQYRSAIFVKDETQKRVATSYIAQLEATKAFAQPIVTKVSPLAGFYRAEDYHQDYATLHPDNSYIAYNDLPKIANLKRVFPTLYREDPVLVRGSLKAN